MIWLETSNTELSRIEVNLCGIIIASACGIPIINVKYIAMNKVQMHAGAISKLLYGLFSFTGDNPRAKGKARG